MPKTYPPIFPKTNKKPSVEGFIVLMALQEWHEWLKANRYLKNENFDNAAFVHSLLILLFDQLRLKTGGATCVQISFGDPQKCPGLSLALSPTIQNIVDHSFFMHWLFPVHYAYGIYRLSPAGIDVLSKEGRFAYVNLWTGQYNLERMPCSAPEISTLIKGLIEEFAPCSLIGLRDKLMLACHSAMIENPRPPNYHFHSAYEIAVEEFSAQFTETQLTEADLYRAYPELRQRRTW